VDIWTPQSLHRKLPTTIRLQIVLLGRNSAQVMGRW
jgi:hypothetical protein